MRRASFIGLWIFIGLIVCVILHGCVHHREIHAVALGPPAPASTAPENTDNLWLLRVNTLVACVCVLGTPLCVGLALWLRSVMFATLALASVSMLIATMATRWVLEHTEAMLACVAGVVLLAVAGLIWHLWRNRAALFGAVSVAEALKPLDSAETQTAALLRRAQQSNIVAAAGAGAAKEIERVRKALGHIA